MWNDTAGAMKRIRQKDLVKTLPRNRRLVVATVLCTWLITRPMFVSAQLDETCQVTVNGQTANVGFGGEFRITNIPIGDNLVRVYAVCTKNGKTRYGRSTFFQVVQGQRFVLSEFDMEFRDTPFPSIESIQAIPDSSTLSRIGQQTQIRVKAIFSNNIAADVSERGFGTTYRTSNPNIATVSREGLVTATGPGIAFITATNEGATAVTRIAVSLSPPTTIDGFVEFANGTPVSGAIVSFPVLGRNVLTEPDGHFSIPNLPTGFGNLKLRAYAVLNNKLFMNTTEVKPLPSRITDVGIITIPETGYVFWVNQSSGSWHTSNNWNTRAVPGPADSVFIGVFSDITVTHSQNQSTIQSLVCDEAFVLSGGNLSIAGASEFFDGFDLREGAALSGNGDMVVNGPLNWTGGLTGSYMVGTGKTTAKGDLTLNGVLTLQQRTLNNTANARWTGQGNIAIDVGAVFNNLSGGILQIENNRNFVGDRTSVFNNAGTLRKVIGSQATRFNGVTFNNSGTVEIQTGLLGFTWGGTSSASFRVDSGAILNFFSEGSGDVIYNLDANSSVTGSGTVILGSAEFSSTKVNIAGKYDIIGKTTVIGSGTTMSFESDATAHEFELLNQGAISGSRNLTVDSLFFWQGGTMLGTGKTIIKGQLELAGNADIVQRTIENGGITTWSGNGDFAISQGAIFDNLSSGTFEIRSNRTLQGETTTRFNNSGILRKLNSTSTTTFQGVVFNNSGTVQVQTGFLNFLGGGTSSGQFSVEKDATLDFGTFGAANPTYAFDSSAVITASGHLRFSSSNFGNTRINFSGTLLWTSTGDVTIGRGTVFNNLVTGVFDIQSDNSFVDEGQATINNSGVVRKSNSPGTTDCMSLFFNNTGTVEVTSGILKFSLTHPQIFQQYTQTAGRTIIRNGSKISSVKKLDFKGGAVNGTGELSADVDNGGQFNPGGSDVAGKIDIVGNYTQTPQGVLNIEIGGLAAGTNFDQLTIGQMASLNGTLNIRLINNFVPSLGDTFVIMTFGSRSGNFATINGLNIGNGLRFDVILNNNDITLTVVQ